MISHNNLYKILFIYRALKCIEKLLILWYNLTIGFHEGHCGTIKSPWGVMTPKGFCIVDETTLC